MGFEWQGHSASQTFFCPIVCSRKTVHMHFFFSDTKFMTLLFNTYGMYSQKAQVYMESRLPHLSMLTDKIARTNMSDFNDPATF